ncbi:hypothetical protein DOI34_24185 [Salmonella enterica subsp. enterica serovar Virchow]|nr:hypothetical protein [Salmonella enterica subsp. enterica]EBV3599666.1 hypothetical protein [Salmonella enterica subsp. enterica serovar Virchow]EFF2130031.1 hypothetical protein [Escherichia coli]MIL09307.1 hypothetical protein [Salmonella enterica subsp. enterica serovar Enteritidis]
MFRQFVSLGLRHHQVPDQNLEPDESHITTKLNPECRLNLDRFPDPTGGVRKTIVAAPQKAR